MQWIRHLEEIDQPRKRTVSQTQATMTEQEAEVFAARLTRVWKPLQLSCGVSHGAFSCWGRIACDETTATYLDVNESQVHQGYYHFIIKRLWGGKGKGLGQIAYDPDENEVQIYTRLEDEDKEAYSQFAAGWLPRFRRNCWLSGCPIEASAHEKTEWIQSFSREEKEAWNLKM